MSDSTKPARLIQISVNPKGGVPKYHVPSATLMVNGVTGDKQRDRRYHGGPQRAVCLYSHEQIEALRAEGHPIEPGTAGENLTLSGLDWPRLKIGDRLRIGDEAQLEITSYTTPFHKISASFANGEFTRIAQKFHPGWSRLYARVLREGTVQTGDVVELEAGVTAVS